MWEAAWGGGGLERRQTEWGKTAVQGERGRLGCRLLEHQGCLGMGLGEGAWRNCLALEAGRGMLQLVLPLQGGDGGLGKHPETGSERGRGWGVRWTPVMFPPYPPSREAWGWLGLWGGTSTGTGAGAGGAGKPQR